MSVFFRIHANEQHPVRSLFPEQYVMRRPTRLALVTHSRSLVVPRVRTEQFVRSFIPCCVGWWNALVEANFAGEGLGDFKSSINRSLRLI